MEKELCAKCKTGKQSYLIDEHSEICPYISCWKDGKCNFYLEENESNVQNTK